MIQWYLFFLILSVGRACEFNLALDLGRPLSSESIHASAPFTAPDINETKKFGTTYRTNSFCGGEHLGTHLDAPSHFSENGWTLDQIPLQRLIANGVFLNVSEEVAGNSSFRLQPSHIDDWIAVNGPFPPNAVLLISYGWAQLYSNRTAYVGTTSTNFEDFIYPGMTAECAQGLAEMEEIVGVGVDTASVDAPHEGRVHAILAARNIYNLEHVNLDQPFLPAKGFKLLSFPMKIANGTGAPARIIALP